MPNPAGQGGGPYPVIGSIQDCPGPFFRGFDRGQSLFFYDLGAGTEHTTLEDETAKSRLTFVCDKNDSITICFFADH